MAETLTHAGEDGGPGARTRRRSRRSKSCLDALSGNPVGARQAFTECLAEAERLSIPFEQGLASHELGRRLPAGDPARDSHLVDARAICVRLGHVRWLATWNRLR